MGADLEPLQLADFGRPGDDLDVVVGHTLGIGALVHPQPLAQLPRHFRPQEQLLLVAVPVVDQFFLADVDPEVLGNPDVVRLDPVGAQAGRQRRFPVRGRFVILAFVLGVGHVVENKAIACINTALVLDVGVEIDVQVVIHRKHPQLLIESPGVRIDRPHPTVANAALDLGQRHVVVDRAGAGLVFNVSDQGFQPLGSLK
jgi:hypothetical protein